MLPPPVFSVADHIDSPPGFEQHPHDCQCEPCVTAHAAALWSGQPIRRPCVPPPSSRPACATPHCTQRVEEPGDTFCARCVFDYEHGEGHIYGCPCGPCAVHSVVAAINRFASTLPEVQRARARRVPETLRAYIARRDGGSK